MNHVCAAYFNETSKVCKQSIEEHILKGIDFLEEMYLKRKFDQYILRLSSLLDVYLDREEACKAIYASYIFHDVGKISNFYQENRSSFSGHEIISAVWVFEHYSILGLKKLVYPVIYAILLHHHDIAKKIPKKYVKANLCPKCLKFLVDLYSRKTNISIIGYKQEANGCIEEILNTCSKIDKELKYIRLGYPLLQLVHSSDNYSASFRGGRQTILSKESIKVYESVIRLRLDFSIL